MDKQMTERLDAYYRMEQSWQEISKGWSAFSFAIQRHYVVKAPGEAEARKALEELIREDADAIAYDACLVDTAPPAPKED